MAEVVWRKCPHPPCCNASSFYFAFSFVTARGRSIGAFTLRGNRPDQIAIGIATKEGSLNLSQATDSLMQYPWLLALRGCGL